MPCKLNAHTPCIDKRLAQTSGSRRLATARHGMRACAWFRASSKLELRRRWPDVWPVRCTGCANSLTRLRSRPAPWPRPPGAHPTAFGAALSRPLPSRWVCCEAARCFRGPALAPQAVRRNTLLLSSGMRAAVEAPQGLALRCAHVQRRNAAPPAACRLRLAAAGQPRPAFAAGAPALAGARVAAPRWRRLRRLCTVASAPRVPEFAPSQVTVDEPLGEGSFGQVYLGTLRRPGAEPETGASQPWLAWPPLVADARPAQLCSRKRSAAWKTRWRCRKRSCT